MKEITLETCIEFCKQLLKVEGLPEVVWDEVNKTYRNRMLDMANNLYQGLTNVKE